jgi:colanic acid biosynthesis glycosyl transferase WcaI
MRIHLISNLFSPDELAGAALFTDLADYLRERGHEIRVTSTFSYYPHWTLKPRDVDVMLRDETIDGIPVRRVSMYIPKRVNGINRLMSDATFLYSLLRRGRHPNWVPDVVITALPMLSQCIAQRYMYNQNEVSKMIIIQDFVVDAALELGILKAPVIGSVLRYIERSMLKSADCLSTISPQMLSKLNHYVGGSKRCVFIPNWIHGSLLKKITLRSLALKKRAEKKLFYSGNLGVKQGLPDFVKTYQESDAKLLGWNLAINGGGAERNRLVDEISNIDSCILGGVLDEDSYLTALFSCTACLVTQRAGVGANFLPSKLLPALATGTPVLAVCEQDSPLAVEVNTGQFGVVIPPNNPRKLTGVLERWSNFPGDLLRLGQNSLSHGRLYYRDKILLQYESVLQSLVR